MDTGTWVSFLFIRTATQCLLPHCGTWLRSQRRLLSPECRDSRRGQWNHHPPASLQLPLSKAPKGPAAPFAPAVTTGTLPASRRANSTRVLPKLDRPRDASCRSHTNSRIAVFVCRQVPRSTPDTTVQSTDGVCHVATTPRAPIPKCHLHQCANCATQGGPPCALCRSGTNPRLTTRVHRQEGRSSVPPQVQLSDAADHVYCTMPCGSPSDLARHILPFLSSCMRYAFLYVVVGKGKLNGYRYVVCFIRTATQRLLRHCGTSHRSRARVLSPECRGSRQGQWNHHPPASLPLPLSKAPKGPGSHALVAITASPLASRVMPVEPTSVERWSVHTMPSVICMSTLPIQRPGAIRLHCPLPVRRSSRPMEHAMPPPRLIV